MSPTATIDSIHHAATGTWQYIVADPNTLDAVIIDPVLDFDTATQTISTGDADHLVSTVKAKGYNIVRILETHAHADHLTASAYLQQVLDHIQGSKPPICIGKRITQVQQTFGEKYGVPAIELENVFDHLLDDDEVFRIGDLQAIVVHLPGHTPDHVGYLIGGEFHEQLDPHSIDRPH
jgi:glyoxylase-like metal-dependent hydrolase (beta-lactamase superfamily II)